MIRTKFNDFTRKRTAGLNKRRILAIREDLDVAREKVIETFHAALNAVEMNVDTDTNFRYFSERICPDYFCTHTQKITIRMEDEGKQFFFHMSDLTEDGAKVLSQKDLERISTVITKHFCNISPKE